jgi:hypothetical protein
MMCKYELQLKFEDFVFPYGKLNFNNEWVRLAQIIPRTAMNLRKRLRSFLHFFYNQSNLIEFA